MYPAAGILIFVPISMFTFHGNGFFFFRSLFKNVAMATSMSSFRPFVSETRWSTMASDADCWTDLGLLKR